MRERRVPETDIRHPSRREERDVAARHGWFNWYVDRGRMPRPYGKNPERLTRQYMRRVSWRRAL